MALPRLVGGDGVQDTFPLPLAALESELLKRSAKQIREALGELDAHA